MPAGTTRMEATSSGRPAGRSSVIVMYVVPQEIGASNVVVATAPARPGPFMVIILISR